VIDLRSDTVTRPSDAMRAAMARAEVGDDLAGEDPTVNRLEALAAAMLGKEAARYVPTGTMANGLAIRALATPGTELLCPARAHVYCYEDAAAARNAGVQVRPLHDEGGVVTAEQVEHAAAGRDHHLPAVSVLVIENTHMASGGRPLPPAEVEGVSAAAHAHGMRVHCDGARVWNAAIALGESPAVLAAPCDTVMFCLSKGLGAPIGSVLCGPADVVARARADQHRLGGGWRQAGVLAAAGIVALETMVDRLAEDHHRARAFAHALADRWPGCLDPSKVHTNIVCAHTAMLPADILDRLGARGVHAGTIDPNTVRFVFHCDIDDHDLATAIATLDHVLAGH
jgi:threonine aldolase